MTRLLPGFAVFALALVPFACGGESSSDGSGGTPSGGTGGVGASGGAPGGTGGVPAGGTGGIPAGGTGGSGACGPMPTGDCIVCGHFTSLICQNGAWTCPPENGCVDASTCPSNQVPTVNGCLSCNDASTQLAAAIESARKANAACGTPADCVLTGSGTTCAGACQIAVSKSGEAAFQAALSKLDADYCSGYVPVCGYATPKCAVPTLECNAGTCEAKFN